MARELRRSLAIRQIAANTGGECRALKQPRYFLVVEPFGADRFALPGDPPKQGAVADPCEFQPGLHRDHRAGGVGRAAADLDLAPAVFPPNVTGTPLWGKTRSSPGFSRSGLG